MEWERGGLLRTSHTSGTKVFESFGRTRSSLCVPQEISLVLTGANSARVLRNLEREAVGSLLRLVVPLPISRRWRWRLLP